MKVKIHTTIPREIKEKLLEYGMGKLNCGIMNLIEIAESKEVTLNIVTEVKLNEL